MSKKVAMTARPQNAQAALDKWVDQPAAKVDSPTGPMKRLTIDLESDKHRKFKALCVEHEINMAEEIRGFVERRITELQGKA